MEFKIVCESTEVELKLSIQQPNELIQWLEINVNGVYEENHYSLELDKHEVSALIQVLKMYYDRMD